MVNKCIKNILNEKTPHSNGYWEAMGFLCFLKYELQNITEGTPWYSMPYPLWVLEICMEYRVPFLAE